MLMNWESNPIPSSLLQCGIGVVHEPPMLKAPLQSFSCDPTFWTSTPRRPDLLLVMLPNAGCPAFSSFDLNRLHSHPANLPFSPMRNLVKHKATNRGFQYIPHRAAVRILVDPSINHRRAYRCGRNPDALGPYPVPWAVLLAESFDGRSRQPGFYHLVALLLVIHRAVSVPAVVMAAPRRGGPRLAVVPPTAAPGLPSGLVVRGPWWVVAVLVVVVVLCRPVAVVVCGPPGGSRSLVAAARFVIVQVDRVISVPVPPRAAPVPARVVVSRTW